MQEIIFRNEEHKEIYYKLLNRINPQYRIHSDMRSMIYLIALNETEAFGLADQIFDFKNRLITPNILNDAWLSSSTKRTILLAFNLWNGYTPGTSIYEIFGCSGFDKYYLEAIRIRFQNTCEFDEEAFFAKFLKKS